MWEDRFIDMVKEIAKWSKDPDEGVGALLVSRDKRSFSAGYNGFPRGIADEEWRLLDKCVKNSLTIHAEENAILNAKRDLAGWTVYTTKPPCLHCTLVIIQAGITEIVMPVPDPESSWFDDNINAISVLSEAGVKIYKF